MKTKDPPPPVSRSSPVGSCLKVEVEVWGTGNGGGAAVDCGAERIFVTFVSVLALDSEVDLRTGFQAGLTETSMVPAAV